MAARGEATWNQWPKLLSGSENFDQSRTRMSEQVYTQADFEETAAVPHGQSRAPEQVVKPLPAQTCVHWVPSKLQSQPQASHPLDVVVTQSVLADVEAHLEGSPNGGAAGLLVGAVFKCPTSGRLWVHVSGIRPFAEPFGEDAEVGEFGAIAVPLIQRTESAGEQVVGWYRGHTSLGVYLSENESVIHNAHFPEMWQLGLIKLTAGRAGGVFLRSPDGALSRSGYWPFYEQLHESSHLASGSLRTFVGWQNHRTEAPVSQAGEDGVTASFTPSPSAHSRNASLAGETTPAHVTGVQKRSAPRGGSSEGPFKQRVDYASTPKPDLSSGLAPGVPSGLSEEEYFAHELKRKLSAVDVTLSSLGPPGPPPSETGSESADSAAADPSPGTAPSDSAGTAPSDSAADESLEVARPSRVTAASAEPAGRLSPPRVRVSPGWLLIVLTVATAAAAGLIWVSSRSSADEAPAEEETTSAVPVPESQSPAAAVGAIPASRVSPPPVEVIGPPPAEVIAEEPIFAGEPSSTPFARAFEILQQEVESYKQQQAEFARGLIGCNVLNSRYRSVDEAFLRLATALAEAEEDGADDVAKQFEQAGTSMDEVDQHFDASSCPRPR